MKKNTNQKNGKNHFSGILLPGHLQKNNLNSLIQTRDSVINDLDGTISEIEQNITFIKNKRGQLEMQQEGAPDQKEGIIEDIALMNTMLEESEKKIEELKENGVVTREGGILGILGKTKALNKNLNDNYFTKLNIRSTQTIPLYTKKAEIITEHSDSSYRFVYQDDLIAYLEIEDPNEFWKLTKYAVIDVK